MNEMLQVLVAPVSACEVPGKTLRRRNRTVMNVHPRIENVMAPSPAAIQPF
jgi:hypothetical protein